MKYTETDTACNNTPLPVHFSSLSPPLLPKHRLTERGALASREESEFDHFPPFPSLCRADESKENFVLKPRPLAYGFPLSESLMLVEDSEIHNLVLETTQTSSTSNHYPLKDATKLGENVLYVREQWDAHLGNYKLDVAPRRNSNTAMSA
jgi:hypothetical protein